MDFNRLLGVVLIFASTGNFSFASDREPVFQTQNAAPLNPHWGGRYILNQNGEMLIDGSRVSLTWDIKIDPASSTANVDMTTLHAPVTCQGEYAVQEKGASLLFTYQGRDDDCHYSAPQFEMKEQRDGYYVNGEMFAQYSNGWQRLVKKNPRYEALIQKLNGTHWQYESVTAEIGGGSQDYPEMFYKHAFGDKPISFVGQEMTMGEYCRLSFSPYFQTAINYYHSNKTLEIYASLFARVGLQLPVELTLLATSSPSGECIISDPEFIDFGNKLAFFYEDKMVIYSRVEGKPATEPAIRKCESGPRDIEYVYEHGEQTRCFYPGMSLEAAYKAHRDARSDSENLLPTLTQGEDLEIENLGDTESVEYQWQGSHVLHIEQNFPGGMTEFLFVADKSGTTVTETGHPD